MKVALFTETYLPDINGVSTHLFTLKDGLEALGHEVLVVTASGKAKRHYIKDGVLYCPSLSIKRFYGFGAASPISPKRFRLLDEFAPDIIHIHHEFGVGLSGIRYARKRKLPLLYTLHTMYDVYVHYVAKKRFNKLATKFSHFYARKIANKTTALASPSRKGELYFQKIGAKKKPFYLVPNSAEMSDFAPDILSSEEKKALRKKLSIGEETTIACFVGRLGEEKRVDVLLDFWAQGLKDNPKLHLLIMGDGPEAQPLRQQAQTLGIQNSITFTGRVEHAVINGYYSICDAYITASLSEMNSISMLEGMASGLPTIQRFDEPNQDQIIENVNGYFFTNPEEMCEPLLRIAALSAEEKTALKAQVRNSVIHRDVKGLARHLLQIYDEITVLHNGEKSARSRK